MKYRVFHGKFLHISFILKPIVLQICVLVLNATVLIALITFLADNVMFFCVCVFSLLNVVSCKLEFYFKI